MELTEELNQDLLRRTRRVLGQIRALERMLDEGRECRDIAPQISAAHNALDHIGIRLVTAAGAYCATRPAEAEADGYTADAVEAMFLQLH